MAELINARELARRLDVPITFVYARTRTKTSEVIPHLKLGKYVRFDPSRVSEWLAKRERGQGA